MKKFVTLLIAIMVVTTLIACSSLVEKGEQARKDEEYIAAQQSSVPVNSESSTSSTSTALTGPIETDTVNSVRVNTPDSSDLRLREGPGTEYKVITSIPHGETVEILNDRDPKWIEIRYGEYFGYAMGEYLAPGGSSANPPAPDNTVSTAFLDPDLIGGRWVATTGERMEFFGNGTMSTNITMFSDFFYTAGTVDIEWEARDGLLTFWGTHTEERTYRVSGNGLTMLVGLYEQPFTRDGNGEGLIGRWSNHTLVGDYEFFSDGTGFNYPYEALGGYADPFPFTWYADDKIITTIESQDRTVDYLVQGSTLTIFTSNSTLLFQKVGGN